MRKIYSFIAAMILTATTWAQILPNTMTVCGSLANNTSSMNYTVTMMYQSYTYNSTDTLVVANNQFCFNNLPIYADTNGVQYYSVVIWANNCQPVVLNGLYNPTSPFLSVALPMCSSNCTANISTSTIPGTTLYSLMATGTGTAPFTYYWSNGSTTQSIPSNPNQTVYNVVITDAIGCSATATYVDSSSVIPCNVTLSAPNAANGNIVATSTGGVAPYTYTWSFNGVTVSTLVNTNSLAPTGNGTYCVNSYDANGCVSTACINYTGSNPTTSCSASFYSFPDSMAMPGTPSFGLINFVSNASGVAPYTYNWSFSDGTTSNQANPSHAFTSPNGNNWACVVITDATGCSSNYCSAVYVPMNSMNCSAYFNSYSTYNAASPGELSFQNLSNAMAPAVYSWSFGDGSSSTAMNPNHTYTSSGTYYVCLTVTSNGCTSSFCQSTYVNLNWWNTNPIGGINCSAGFVVLPGNASTGVITIVDISQVGTGSYYNWTINNVNSSNSTNPFLNLGGVGSYLLCLSVIDSVNSCYSTFCDTLTVDSAGNVFKSLSSFNGTASINVVSAPKKLTSTGIENYASQNVISVVPNPASNLVKVSFNENKSNFVQVIDLNGKIVKSLNAISTNQIELNVSDLSEGLYIVKLTNATGVTTTKLNVVK
jgi:PKD repeat protein